MLTVTFTIFSFGLYAVRKGKPRCFSHPFFCLIYLPDQRPMQSMPFRIPSCNSSFKQRTSCLAPIAALSHKIRTMWARQPLQLPANNLNSYVSQSAATALPLDLSPVFATTPYSNGGPQSSSRHAHITQAKIAIPGFVPQAHLILIAQHQLHISLPVEELCSCCQYEKGWLYFNSVLGRSPST